MELSPPADAVVRRVFDMVLQGRSILDVTKTLNAEGIPTTNGKKWLKTTIHTMLDHEAYTGTLVWGANAKGGAPPVRVEDAHPTIVSKRDFQRTRRLLASRAPKKMNPRRLSSNDRLPFLYGLAEILHVNFYELTADLGRGDHQGGPDQHGRAPGCAGDPDSQGLNVNRP